MWVDPLEAKNGVVQDERPSPGKHVIKEYGMFAYLEGQSNGSPRHT